MTDPVPAVVDPVPEPGAAGSLAGARPASRGRSADAAAHARRISYFMLFRLAVLFAFTILAGLSSWYRVGTRESAYEWATWGTLGVGYFVTLLFAWTLPGVRYLSRVAWAQSALDIALSTAAAQLTGGVESAFAFLYLVAILGAATMGDRRQTWAATGACAFVYLTAAALQATGLALPLDADPGAPGPTSTEIAVSAVRTLAAMGGVGVLSAYLNVQLLSSVRQVGSLRAINEHIVRSLTSGLLTVDAGGRVQFANPTALDLLGLRGPLEGTHVDELLPGAGRHLQDSGGPHHRFELELRRADGRTIHFGLNCAPLLDGEGRFLGHVVHFQDVTELHELARKARRHERLAAIGGLAASVAHEVRNPLAAISGSAELLEGSVADEDDRKLLGVIQREASRLDKTVSDLLAFTRPKPPERVQLELGRAVSEILEAFRADPTNARVEIAFTASGPVSAAVDPSQFSQILWNLLRNAVEATGGHGSLRIELERERDGARLSVADDGPGIPPEALERVFEPFFSTKEKGSGFGLALAHRIVQDHGGELGVESTPGHGATFTVRLPLAGRPAR